MYFKIGLRSGYHHLRIREEDVLKIAFQICYRHYEFLIMPFVLKHAPIAFIDLMIRVFNDSLDKFVVIFIDDILVYFRNNAEYKNHLHLMLCTLQREQLYAKYYKCIF